MKIKVKHKDKTRDFRVPVERGRLVCHHCKKVMETREVDVESWSKTGHIKYHECKRCFYDGK